MLHRFTEHELLDLIEGTESPEGRGLRALLESDPKALELVERMKADRAVLRSMESPPLPMDFLDRIEPLLARPMLIETAETAALPSSMAGAAELRRKHRRRTRRVVWSRLVAAAVVFATLIAGMWAGVQSLMVGPTDPSEDSLALNDPDGGAANEVAPAELQPLAVELAAGPGSIHHYPTPRIIDDQMLGGRADALRSATPDSTVAKAGPALVAEFAVVVQAADPSAAEALMSRAIADLGPQQGALVRNFSFDHARQLEEEWRLAHRGRGAAEPSFASDDLEPRWRTPADLTVLADRVRQRLQRAAAGAPADREASAQLVGPVEIAPALERQLDFSSRGASHTIAVPAEKVAEVIDAMGAAFGHATALRMLPAGARALNDDAASLDSWQPLSLWLTEGPLVRQAIRQLAESPSGAVVHVPVIVREVAAESKSQPQRN